MKSEMTEWYRYDVNTTLQILDTHINGLSDTEAQRRISQYGPNELVERGAKNPFLILWEQLTATMVLILLAAAILSAFLGKWLEAGAILAIVILFAVLGFIQEYRAERAIAALKKLAVPFVRVTRNGNVRELPAQELVPGDILLLEAGNILPADVRLIESSNLRIQESALTGESEAVEKHIDPIDYADVPLGDRRNMGYMGTIITYGRGTAVVVHTGMQTELGRIAAMIQDVKDEMTPLQQRLDSVGKNLAIVGVVVAVLVMIGGIAAGERWDDMLLTAISVAVAVIPEGLPAVVTFTLALGAQRMLKRNALIRKLPAVETLGSVTTICSDKTGTLTENRMTVTVIDVAGHRIDLMEQLKHRVPVLTPQDARPELLMATPIPISMVLAGGALCNDALIHQDGPSGNFHTIGDPTEGALLVASAQVGMLKDDLSLIFPRIADVPFDSDRKRMTTLHRRTDGYHQYLSSIWGANGLAQDNPYLAITKGAVDGLLDVTTHVWDNDQVVPLGTSLKQRIQEANDQMARNGMRVLGVAFRLMNDIKKTDPSIEHDLIFVGMVGLIDPPRPEVRQAVQTCIRAGIRPVMITGDHPLTAYAIARDLGIAQEEKVLTGHDLSRMNDDDLQQVVEHISVYARVSPEHKLKIVAALRTCGHVVAMTGDGVNDAPALKKADIGVAMGITGTDVSKEAADMVLRDDNFATIVAAIEEGRVIYDNLRRFIKFAVAGNAGKIGVMLCWPFPFLLLGMPLNDPVVLLPLQLLWLNLMTDGLLGLSIGVEPAERTVMQRPPHSPKEGIFNGGMGIHIVWVGIFITIVTMMVGIGYYFQNLPQWQTMIFTTTAFLQIFHALATRSNRDSLLTIGIFTNRVMMGIIALIALLQIAAVTIPPLRDNFLRLHSLSLRDFLICIGAGASLLIAVEFEKWLLRRKTIPYETT